MKNPEMQGERATRKGERQKKMKKKQRTKGRTPVLIKKATPTEKPKSGPQTEKKRVE